MSTPAIDAVSELQSFRHQAQLAHRVVRLNADGLTHEESLVQPRPGGNCLNWIVGHLVWVYAGALPMLHQEPVLQQDTLSRYARGAPLRHHRRAAHVELGSAGHLDGRCLAAIAWQQANLDLFGA